MVTKGKGEGRDKLGVGLTDACMLSRFSRVQLFAAPWTVACQARLSMGFSRQEYWSGLPRPPPLKKQSKQNDKTNMWMSYTILYLNLHHFFH